MRYMRDGSSLGRMLAGGHIAEHAVLSSAITHKDHVAGRMSVEIPLGLLQESCRGCCPTVGAHICYLCCLWSIEFVETEGQSRTSS